MQRDMEEKYELTNSCLSFIILCALFYVILFSFFHHFHYCMFIMLLSPVIHHPSPYPPSNVPLLSIYSDLQRRRLMYGRNEFDEPERTSWLSMFLTSFEDTTLIVLIVAAVVSLAVGLYEDIKTGKQWH